MARVQSNFTIQERNAINTTTKEGERTGPIAFDGELTRARFAKRLFAMSRLAVIRKFKENK